MITIIDPLGVLFNREIPYDDDDDDDLYSADESFFQHPKLTGKIFSKKATNQAASVSRMSIYCSEHPSRIQTD